MSLAATSDASLDRDLPPSRRIAAGSRAFTCREAGAAGSPALVLLHGIGSGSASWTGQFQPLAARGLRVVAWDAPGYGGSDTLPSPSPGAEGYAAALAALVDALGLARFWLLGHSLGALMAAAFAGRHGAARLDGLVLASPALGYRHATAEVKRAKTEARLADMARFGPAGIAERRAAAVLSLQAPALAVERVRAVMRGLRPEGYASAVRMLGEADIFADAAAVAVPTLVLCGTADQVTPEEGCRRVAAAIAGARYRALPGLSHAAYVEDPPGFNQALLDFLARPEAA